MKSIGHDIPEYEILGLAHDVTKHFDKLSLSQFSQAVKHIHFHYQKAVNNNRKSGTHDNFDQFIGDKYWLLLLHHRLGLTGNRDLQMIAYPELTEVITSLGCSQTSNLTQSSTSSQCSESPNRSRKNNKKTLDNNEDQKSVRARRESLESISKSKEIALRTQMMNRYEELGKKILEATDKINELGINKHHKIFLKKMIKMWKSESSELEKDLKSINRHGSQAQVLSDSNIDSDPDF